MLKMRTICTTITITMVVCTTITTQRVSQPGRLSTVIARPSLGETPVSQQLSMCLVRVDLARAVPWLFSQN